MRDSEGSLHPYTGFLVQAWPYYQPCETSPAPSIWASGDIIPTAWHGAWEGPTRPPSAKFSPRCWGLAQRALWSACR